MSEKREIGGYAEHKGPYILEGLKRTGQDGLWTGEIVSQKSLIGQCKGEFDIKFEDGNIEKFILPDIAIMSMVVEPKNRMHL